MRKLLVLILVLGTAQIGWAGIASLRVAYDDLGDDFWPGGIITIEIVAWYDTGMGGTDTTGTISMDYVKATSGEVISTWLNPGFDDMHYPGTLINSGGNAVSGVWGSVAFGSPDIAEGAVLWSMQFRIPDVPLSTIIEISTENFWAAPTDVMDFALETNVLTLHFIPEPITVALLGLGGLFLRRRSK